MSERFCLRCQRPIDCPLQPDVGEALLVVHSRHEVEPKWKELLKMELGPRMQLIHIYVGGGREFDIERLNIDAMSTIPSGSVPASLFATSPPPSLMVPPGHMVTMEVCNARGKTKQHFHAFLLVRVDGLDDRAN